MVKDFPPLEKCGLILTRSSALDPVVQNSLPIGKKMWTDPDPVLHVDSVEVTSACCRKIQLRFTRKLLWTAVTISTSFDLELR